jgi:hypothetical protein
MQLCRPEPAYPTNAPIEELRTPELFVLASLRHWVAPQRDPNGTHGDWRVAFQAAAIEDRVIEAAAILEHPGLHEAAAAAASAPPARRPRLALVQ